MDQRPKFNGLFFQKMVMLHIKIKGLTHAVTWRQIFCSRVMSIFTFDRPKWYSVKPRHRFAYQWLDNLKINKYAKVDANIYCVVQGLWAFSLTDHDRPDWCSAKPHPSKKNLLRMPVVRQCWQNLIKIYRVVQELWAFSLTAYGWADGKTDGKTNSHSDRAISSRD